jgi:hypothetical protein
LALQWHPDKNEDKEKAEKMFQDISEAYEVSFQVNYIFLASDRILIIASTSLI